MEINRSLSLSPRKEFTRNAKEVEPPIQFSLLEINKHFTENLRSIEKQFTVAETLFDNGEVDGSKTVLRSIAVFAEGLLDFYIHEVSKYCLFRMFTGQWSKSEKYMTFMVPMEKVEKAIESVESKNWFFSYLNERFSREVYLSKESMRDQLNLIGVGFKDVMIKAFPRNSENESIKEGSNIVTELFKRRNEIVHQNDMSHLSAVQNDITEDYVKQYITWVNLIVDAIQNVVENKNMI